MSDLISRSALLKCFSITKDGRRIPEKDCDNFEVTVSIKDIKRIIKEQPTAYNVDAVVDELESLSNAEADYYYASSNDVIDRETAIEIVRKGGVNE